jgi:hypothetical protein
MAITPFCEIWGTDASGTAGALSWGYWGTLTPELLGTRGLWGSMRSSAGTLWGTAGTQGTYESGSAWYGTWWGTINSTDMTQWIIPLTADTGGTWLALLLNLRSTTATGMRFYFTNWYGSTFCAFVGSSGTTGTNIPDFTAPSYFSVTHTGTGTYTATVIPAGKGTYSFTATQWGAKAPAVNFRPGLGFTTTSTANRAQLRSMTWPYGTGGTITPQATYFSVLDYIGTYADGSASGTLHFGSAVMSIGDACEQVYFPATTRGWSSQITVKIDDSPMAGSLWTLLVKNRENETWLAGTWQVRQCWTAGTEHNLLTGFVRAADWAYDAQARTVDVTIRSMLERYAEMSVPINGGTGPAEDPDIPGYSSVLPYRMFWLAGTGTCTSADYDGGTYVSDNLGDIGWNIDDDYMTEFGRNTRLYPYHGTTDEPAVIGSSLGTGNFTLDEDPGWMHTNKTFYAVSPWPSSWHYSHFGRNLVPYLKLLLYHWGIGSNANNWNTLKSALSYYPYYGHARYYGGEKFIDILHNITAACNLSYSLDGDGNFVGLVPLPNTGGAVSPLGTIDFLDAFNKSYGVYASEPVNTIDTSYGYDHTLREYAGSFAVENGTWQGGRSLSIKTPWIGNTIQAKMTAWRLFRLDGVPRLMFSLDLDGRQWENFTNGAAYSVTNIPPDVGAHTGSLFRITRKTYNFENDVTSFLLAEEQAKTGFVIWGSSVTWNTGKVWW